MNFQKFQIRLQILLLAFVVATAYSQTSVAQTPKQMLALIKSSKILADKQPVAGLSDRKLARQRKTLTRFVKSPLGSPDLKRQAGARLAQINFEISRRQNVAATGGKKRPVAGANPATVRPPVPAVLRDRRPSASLPTRQLQARFRVLRDIVKNRRVNRNQIERARKMRDADLAEMRKRNAATVSSRLLAVLEDRRPSTSLATPQLRQRIKSLSDVIAATASRPRLRTQARAMHARDRRELKNRSRGSISPRLTALLNDGTRPRSLSRAQLKGRITLLGDSLRGGRLTAKQRQSVKNLRRRYVAEVKRRKAVAPQATPQRFAVLQDQRPSISLATPQLRQRIRNLSDVIAATASRPRLRTQARAMHARDTRELKVRSRGSISPRLAAVLNDGTGPRSLLRTQLRGRITLLGNSLQGARLTAKQRQRIKNLRRRYVAELNRRKAAAPQPNPQGFAVLQDRRPPENLNTVELRTRVNTLRNSLRQRGTGRNIRLKLSQKLRFDRTELRRRVAERRARLQGRDFQPVVPNPPRTKLSEQARRLLSDYRASGALNRGQLNNRIRSARKVLKFVSLSAAQRVSLRNMIASDRAEKSRRLLAARDRRRAKLERQRSRGELRIEINPGPGFAPLPLPHDIGDRRGDIAAAEADEGQIQRQFLEPDRKTYERRYSREEIVRRPDLTRGFAGIDVDTINFGFNEYWIREEEIDQLERMATTMERILAARPNEVFQIEGHTDAVGSEAYNLKLSLQRAQAVKQALTKFFVIPARALVTVGLGERYLKIPTPDAESENRRVTIRRITPIVRR